MNIAALTLACAAGAIAVGCEGGATRPEPVPGDLVVTVVSPNGDEGAALLETSDPGIVGVTAANGQAFHRRSDGVSRIAVVLDEPGTIAFQLAVEDVNVPPELELIEVADGGNALRADLAGYQVAAEPVEGS